MHAPGEPEAQQFLAAANARTGDVRRQFAHRLGIAYGDHPRQVLDLYEPAAPADAVPFVVFVHGGRFREGAPDHYGYVGTPFLRRGCRFASVGYRLIPDAYFPETARDLEQALVWLTRETGARDMLLIGHSAGAVLAAHVGLRDDWAFPPSAGQHPLLGLVLLGGLYARPPEAGDPSRFAEAPAALVVSPPPCTLVVVGTREPVPVFNQQAAQLVDAIAAHGATARLLTLDGMAHFDTVNSLDDERGPLLPAVLDLAFRTQRQNP